MRARKTLDHIGRGFLFYFLFQVTKQFTVKELLNGDAQAVTQFFDGGDGGAAVAAADNVVDGGLGDTANSAELVDGNICFLTQLYNALFDRFADIHGPHLTSSENDTHFLLKRLTLLS